MFGYYPPLPWENIPCVGLWGNTGKIENTKNILNILSKLNFDNIAEDEQTFSIEYMFFLFHLINNHKFLGENTKSFKNKEKNYNDWLNDKRKYSLFATT